MGLVNSVMQSTTVLKLNCIEFLSMGRDRRGVLGFIMVSLWAYCDLNTASSVSVMGARFSIMGKSCYNKGLAEYVYRE